MCSSGPREGKEEWGAATYILEGVLIPEDLVLLDLVLEELGYPEQSNRSVPISVDQEQSRWAGEGERKGNLTSFLGWRGRRGRGGREARRRRRPWRRRRIGLVPCPGPGEGGKERGEGIPAL
jgi:hypothetical protein